jgi:hypothetical protein
MTFKKATLPEIGTKRGLLTVIEHIKPTHTSTVYRKNKVLLCLCDCGNKVEKNLADFTRKRSEFSSCGCLKRQRMITYSKNRKETPEVVTVKRIIESYTDTAKRRGILFSLSFDVVRNIIFSNCFYCEKQPSNFMKTRNRRPINIFYSGIDRVDNSKGYEEGNVVPCCWECNNSKRSVTVSIARKMMEFENAKRTN